MENHVTSIPLMEIYSHMRFAWDTTDFLFMNSCLKEMQHF